MSYETHTSNNHQLEQLIATRVEEGIVLARTLAADYGLCPMGEGYADAAQNAYTTRITTPEQADQAKAFLEASGVAPSPSHLFLMSQKGAASHLVYENGELSGVVITHLQVRNGNLYATKTYEAGSDSARTLGSLAVELDTLQKGVDVDWPQAHTHQLSPTYPALERAQAELSAIYAPDKFGFTESADQPGVLMKTLPDGNMLIIRPLQDSADYQAVRDISDAAWQLNGDPNTQTIPQPHDLEKFNHPDNTMLVAEINGRIVSYVFGFPGLKQDHLVLYSHIAATNPDYQSQGVMRDLKMAQVIMAARTGYSEIHWTYNPYLDLTRPNHAFNFGTLGAVCNIFLKDVYSPAIKVGIYDKAAPVDRFDVVQQLTSLEFQNHVFGTKKKAKMSIDEAGKLPRATPESTAPRLHFPLLKPGEDDYAYSQVCRETLAALFNAGYAIVNVASNYQKDQGATEAYFILERTQ